MSTFANALRTKNQFQLFLHSSIFDSKLKFPASKHILSQIQLANHCKFIVDLLATRTLSSSHRQQPKRHVHKFICAMQTYFLILARNTTVHWCLHHVERVCLPTTYASETNSISARLAGYNTRNSLCWIMWCCM